MNRVTGEGNTAKDQQTHWCLWHGGGYMLSWAEPAWFWLGENQVGEGGPVARPDPVWFPPVAPALGGEPGGGGGGKNLAHAQEY